MNQYYTSHKKLPLIGEQGQSILQQAKVLVIGAGGLGCPCLQYLVGAGIGVIGIADYDIVSESNLHRQVLYNFHDIGKNKIAIAKEKLFAQNTFIKIEAHQLFVDQNNVLSLLSGYDVIIDCTDNFQVRYLINDASVVLDKPLVYGAIHQTEGHVTVFNYNQSPTLRCLFPEEDNTVIKSCADIGAYNIITGIIGLLMANEVIKIILQHENVLASFLYQFDVLTSKSSRIKYQSSAFARQQSMKRFVQPSFSKEIYLDELLHKMKNNDSFFLIDVRETEERSLFNIGGEHIPLQQLLTKTTLPFAQSDLIIIYCEKGLRSQQAAQYFTSKGYTAVKSLSGGIELFKSFV